MSDCNFGDGQFWSILSLGTYLKGSMNSSLWTDTFSNKFKITANVSSIFRLVTVHPANYHPTSLTRVCCELARCIILLYLRTTLDRLLYANQHGLRSSPFCNTQMITVVCDLVSPLDGGMEMLTTTVLHFSKALDRGRRHILFTTIDKTQLT